MKIKKESFGRLWNKEASLYTLENKSGMCVRITDYGGIITQWKVPAPNGKTADIALGFDTFAEYLAGHPYFGAIAGRYANRIKEGRFILDGKAYQLAAQNNGNHLHGGLRGFDKFIWESSIEEKEDAVSLILELSSPDGDEGFPGTLQTQAVYTLFADNRLELSFLATTDKPTIINLTNHTYFNLAGHHSGDTKQQRITLHADGYLPVDATQIPIGEVAPVEGSPYDCRSESTMKDLYANAPEGIIDHCFVLANKAGEMKKIAEVVDPNSGRRMTLSTDNVGVQFYNGNKLGDLMKVGKGGVTYGAYAGFCLETQCFPDTPNRENFPSCILRPGEEYSHKVVYDFN